MRWPTFVVFALLAGGCLTLTPEGAQVKVYQAPLDGPPAKREMPDGCRKVATLGEDRFSESMIEAKPIPIAASGTTWAAREATSSSCSSSRRRRAPVPSVRRVPIGDCPGLSGAWCGSSSKATTARPMRCGRWESRRYFFVTLTSLPFVASSIIHSAPSDPVRRHAHGSRPTSARPASRRPCRRT